MKVSVYLNFRNGLCREAFNFYKSVFGKEIGFAMTWGDAGPKSGYKIDTDADKEKIMHMEMALNDHMKLMGADVPDEVNVEDVTKKQKTEGSPTSSEVLLDLDSEKEVDKLYEALKEGGEVSMPLAHQFWGDYYGNVVDKYGFSWALNYSPPKENSEEAAK